MGWSSMRGRPEEPKPPTYHERTEQVDRLLAPLVEVLHAENPDPGLALTVIRESVSHFEEKARTFLMAYGSVSQERIVRVFRALMSVEAELFDEERIRNSTTEELIMLAKEYNGNIQNSVANLQKMLDGASRNPDALGDPRELAAGISGRTMQDQLVKMQELGAQGRERVRRLFEMADVVDVTPAPKPVSPQSSTPPKKKKKKKQKAAKRKKAVNKRKRLPQKKRESK